MNPGPDAPPPPAPRRIAILGARGIPARYGGFETFAEELAVRLAARGAEVTVFCEDRVGPKLDVYHGVALRYVKAWAPGPARTIQFDLSCLARAARGFDVVYMLGYGASFGCLLPRLFGREVWINMDGLEWRRSKWSRLARAYLKLTEGLACKVATRLVFDNKALADEVRGRRLSTRPYSVLEYGAPVLRERLDPGPLGRFDVLPEEYHLVVCRFEPENHVIEAARVAAARSGKPLLIVANKDVDTPYARATLEYAQEGVRFLGAIYEPGALLPLRQHCLAYIHGHSVGGTNPSLVEALGAGNLVIAHDNPFNREVLGDAGLYFASESELARRLDEVERMTPAERRELRGAARARAESWYSWERIADLYFELLTGASRSATPVSRRLG